MLNELKLFLPLSTASLEPLDCNNLLGTFSFSLVEPTLQRENYIQEWWQAPTFDTKILFRSFKNPAKFLHCTIGWSLEARGRPCSPFASAPKSLRPMRTKGLVQGATHILHKLVDSCVAKWCHLPESMFIIEVLKAYSVATVIHQHIKEALAPCKACQLSLSALRNLEQRRIEWFPEWLWVAQMTCCGEVKWMCPV